MSVRSCLRWLALALCMVLPGMAWFGPPARAATTYGDCYWDGTPPFCGGRCRPGYEVRNQKFCFNGSKVYCCRRIECTPARYGTPGCPYPGFGSRSNVGQPTPCPAGTTGSYPNCRPFPGGGCGPGMRGKPPNCYLDVR